MKTDLPAPSMTAEIGGVVTNRVTTRRPIGAAARARSPKPKPLKNGARRADAAGYYSMTVSATKAEWEAIDKAAAARGETRSAFVRRVALTFVPPPHEDPTPTEIRCLAASHEEWAEIDRRATNARVGRSDFLRKACAAAIAAGNGATDVNLTSKSAPDTITTTTHSEKSTTTRSDRE